ncbi:MAG TPA: hypothetical protein VGP47_10365 [Parachlamydiaceae bacterium]|nr:hypothetical protein [Nitrosopumilus sp.]HEV8052887.1 hypothetical protein [Parachlamydiaceae bacterium]
MTKFDQIATKIIREQELVVGPIAWDQADMVNGLQIIDKNTGEVSLDEIDAINVVDRLVKQYESLFGRASREFCKDAVSGLLAELSPSEVPSTLR